jgi:CBS domain-containing protein
VETAVINYRVADFLKKHPPFPAVDEKDLLALAGSGHVRFFEPNEYIVVQGDPYRLRVFVIQQGTVTLWDETGEKAELRDVRGAGDFIGIEQYNNLDFYPYSAKSASDVVVYIFSAIDFEAHVLKYSYAQQYVAAYGNVAADYKPAEEARDPKDLFVHDLVAGKDPSTCDATWSIGKLAKHMLTTGAEAVVSEKRARTVLTVGSLLGWVAEGGGNPDDSVETLHGDAVVSIASNASVADGTLAIGSAQAGVLAVTQDGTANGQLHGIVTSRDLAPVFGDQPAAIQREIRLASSVSALRDLNQRARAFVLRYLNSATSVEWLARFVSMTDVAIVQSVLALTQSEALDACWCFCGSAGRGETLTKTAPELVMIFDDRQDRARCHEIYNRVSEALAGCGYLANSEMPFKSEFYAASASEWKGRYRGWVIDPVANEMYRARPLFDLRFAYGMQSLWQAVESELYSAMNRDFLLVLANDCLASLPPLTFFQDAVVSESGEESAVFRLEYSALRPLVDVGRVFGMASGRVLGGSTLERFEMARTLLPDHASIFRAASDTLRIILWQQGRVGISQNTDGAELPPSLLSRYDRQVLKGGFRSIHQLLEFTADSQWLQNL